MFLFIPWWLWGIGAAAGTAVAVAKVTDTEDAPETAQERVTKTQSMGAGVIVAAVVLGVLAYLGLRGRK